MAKYRVQGPDGAVHLFEGPDDATPAQVEAFAAQTFGAATPPPSGGIPGPRVEKQGFLSKLGAGTAALADTTIGGVLPMLGSVVQAGARPFTSPQQAEQLGGAVSSALEKPFGKTFGVVNTPAYKGEATQQLMDFISTNTNKGADWIAQHTGMPVEDVRNMLGTLTTVVAPKAIAAAAPVVKAGAVKAATAVRQSPLGQAIEQPIVARNALTAQNKTLQSYQNAPRIDAAKDALDLGVALNPAVSNPTAANKLRSAVVGSDTLDTKLAQYNQSKFTEAAKADMGLPATTTLNAKAFEDARARTELSAPYNAVRELKALTPDENTMAQLDRLKVQPLVGDTGQAAAANKVLDAVKEHIAPGVDGKTLLNSIRARRQEAQAVYKQRDAGVNPPTPEAVAKADMNLAVANALENMIDLNVKDPKVLADLRAARVNMAKTYDYERATNFATGQLDPQVIARMAAEGKPLTGTLAKIGNVAANYPEVSRSGMLNEPNWRETLPRSGAAGVVGGALAQAVGIPFYYGGVAGATAGNLAGGVLAKGTTKPKFQAANAMPPDYRPPAANNLNAGKTVNNLRP